MHALRIAALLPLLLVASTARAQLTTPDPAMATSKDSLVTAENTVPQRDIFDLLHQYVFKRRVEPQVEIKPKQGLQWALLPTFSYNPIYGAAFGAMISGAGRRGSDQGRYSSLAISANYSTTGQFQLQARGDVFSPGENYLFKADFRYLDTARPTWGLGPVYTNQQEYPMSFLLNRVYGTVLRRVSGPVYLGVGYHYDQFSDIVDDRAIQEGIETPFSVYSGGSPTKTVASGFSLNMLADTRDNLVNPRHGYYLSWAFRDYLEQFGSDESWQELWVEARVYPHVPKRSNHILAFWLYGWFSFGPAPYLNLPSNGWDTYGRGARGYVAGRIRGQSQIYVEAEYRRALTRDGLWGLVLFTNIVSTTQVDLGTFGDPDPGVGAGIRVKFNKHTDTNLTLDHGWGRDGSRGWFLGMTEVF
jgi:hypothetical protein